MNEITLLIDWIQNIGFIGVLVILAIPKLRQKIFGFNGYDIMKHEIERIGNALIEHMKEEQKEMKSIKESMSNIKQDVAYIKGKMKR